MCGGSRGLNHMRGEGARRSRVLPGGVGRVGRARTIRSPDPRAAAGLRDGQSEGLSGLEVDHQLELRRLRHCGG
jgi:hypothetical protein